MTVDVQPATVTACPACESSTGTAAGGTAAGFDTWVEGRNFHQPAYAVLRCETCALYYKSVTLAAETLAAYYALLDSTPFDTDANFPTDRLVQARLSMLPDGSDVLDFGCSTGRVLASQARRLRCVGVEPNAAAAARAAERGIAITSERALWQSDRMFDAILLTDVYEHLAAPVGLFERLARRLRPGGWLVLVTGNADGVTGPTPLAEFWYFRLPGHLCMVSERHLTWLAGRVGLSLAAMHRCSHYDDAWHVGLRQRVQSFAYQAFRWNPRGPVARLLRCLPRLKNAEHWSSAPALTCGDDHVVAFFERV